MFEFEAVDGGRDEAASAELSRGSACAGELVSTSSDGLKSTLISSTSRESPFGVWRTPRSHPAVLYLDDDFSASLTYLQSPDPGVVRRHELR